MIKVIVIGEGENTIDNFRNIMGRSGMSNSIVTGLHSISDAMVWLGLNPMPNLIFIEVSQINEVDFSVYQKIQLGAPIVFTIAINHFIVGAFNRRGIDYLINIFNERELVQAITWYRNLSSCFSHSPICEDHLEDQLLFY